MAWFLVTHKHNFTYHILTHCVNGTEIYINLLLNYLHFLHL